MYKVRNETKQNMYM